MIYDKSRLDRAYEQVELFADAAWSSDDKEGYARANQDLLLQESSTTYPCERIGMPRSVLDTIPNSHLAEYGTYIYDDLRESAYVPNDLYNSSIVITDYSNFEECWMMPEIEELFCILSDPLAKTSDLEEMCVEVARNMAGCNVVEDFETDDVDGLLDLETEETDMPDQIIRHHPPRGTASTFSELVLQMQLHSEDVRALWSTSTELYPRKICIDGLSVDVPEFYPKVRQTICRCGEPIKSEIITQIGTRANKNFEETKPVKEEGSYYPCRDAILLSPPPELDISSSKKECYTEIASRCGYKSLSDNPLKGSKNESSSTQFQQSKTKFSKDNDYSNMVLVPGLQPWLNYGYPMRAEDFHSLDKLVNNIYGLQPTVTTVTAPPATTTTIVVTSQQQAQAQATKEPTRRLYSAVVQNQNALSSSVDDLDDLERQALEQYRPSVESLNKGSSDDSLISAKFQELERLAMEQYSGSSSTENCAVSGVSMTGQGNGGSPLHEPPCGGKQQSPYAALLINSSVLATLRRSLHDLLTARLMACFGAGVRHFR